MSPRSDAESFARALRIASRLAIVIRVLYSILAFVAAACLPLVPLVPADNAIVPLVVSVPLWMLAFVLLLIWLVGAHRVVRRLEHRALDFSAAELVVSFFVPVYNLQAPARMVRALDDALSVDPAAQLVTASGRGGERGYREPVLLRSVSPTRRAPVDAWWVSWLVASLGSPIVAFVASSLTFSVPDDRGPASPANVAAASRDAWVLSTVTFGAALAFAVSASATVFLVGRMQTRLKERLESDASALS